MNETTKSIIDNIFEELIALRESIDGNVVSVTVKAKEPAPEKVEMLTIKESAELIVGLSEHTVRQLVAQGKVKSVRTGEGKSGKIG
ncbi:MAG: helix-turn-helix domain-containing protein [Ruminococcus sp.]|nr:helix-turn-helix domain-containing protein [Ruminococcus sp.]